MKVAVKKRVLFDLLKNRLNENRMPDGDHGGRMIHPFNIQSPNSDPFGFYEDEDDTPIRVSDHMSVQLSVPKMPVEDEDFVPSTITELCNSATLICKEVPISQIEYFYRQLHILLDEALDRDDQRGLDVVNETFEISQQTTIKDFNIIAESSRIRQRTNTPVDAQESDAYNEAENKKAYLDGYKAGTTDANPSPERAEQLSMGSQDFINGYMQALREDEIDIESDIDTVLDPEFDRPIFPSRPGEQKMGSGKPLFDSFEQFLARGTEIDPVTGDIDTTAYDNAPPQEKAAMDASAALQEVFKEIHNEATAIMMDPKMAREFGAMMTPVTQEFGLSSGEILTPLNVGRAFAYVNKMKDQQKKIAKIQELQMKFFVVISEALDTTLQRKPRVRKSLKGYASDANIPFDQFLVQLKQDIAGAYTQYGATSRIALEGGDAAVVSKKIDDLFAVFIKTLKLPGTDNKFKDRSHFYRNVNLESMEEILDGFKVVVDNQFKDTTNPGLYVIRDKDAIVGLEEEEIMGLVETFINSEFEEAERRQLEPTPQEEIDVSDEDTDEITEVEIDDGESEKYMSALERFGKRYAEGKGVEWQELAPFFGFSGTAGIRQWYLKDVLPKLEAMAFTDSEGQPSNIASLQDDNAALIVDKMIEAVQDLIPKYERDVAKNKIKQRTVDPKKNKVKEAGTVEILGALKEQILPVLELLKKLFAQGVKFTEIAEDPNHFAHGILQVVGGEVFREVQDIPISDVVDSMQKRRKDLIADEIIDKVGTSAITKQKIVEKGGIAEYFTGQKGLPEFDAPSKSKKGKVVAKLLAIGLTPEIFAEVLAESTIIWKEVILDELQYEGGEFRDEIVTGYKNLIDDKKLMEKVILKAILTISDEVYQQRRERTPGI